MSLAVLGTVYPVIFISELPDKTMFATLVLATRGRALAVWAGAAGAFAVHVCIAVTVGAALFTWLPHRTVQALAAALFLVGAAWAFRGSADGLSAAEPPPEGLTPAEPTAGPPPAEPTAGSAAAEPAPAGPTSTELSAAGPTPTELSAAGPNPARPTADALDSAEATGATRITPNPAAAVAPQGTVVRVFLTTFAVVFLAEWGDLTQILTASLAARFHAPLAVGLGAGLALWSVTALAVVASRPLRRLPAAFVRRLTGVVLLVLTAFAAVAAATGP
jgi:putative Ca2+/H+ antiporter (TMEM165/GDT1 family)